MIDVGGRPNLEGVVAIMRDQLRIREIVIILGAYGERIRQHFGSGDDFGVRISYVENDAVERGLGYSLLLARPFVRDFCCVILSDECYVGSNHHEILTSNYRDHIAMCAVQATEAPELISRNYAVYASGDLVQRVVEKPVRTRGALLGLGTFVLRHDFFSHLQRAVDGTTGPSDPVSVIGNLCGSGTSVVAFPLQGLYVNINDRDALNLASVSVRSEDFDTRSKGLALLMKGSADDARRTVREFRQTNAFDEIILVVPPGAPSPEDVGVRVVPSLTARYGDVMRAGFEALSTDILMCAHADGSCRPRDVPKFFAYLKDADIVVGTRTTRQLVEQGTNMRGLVRAAHVVLAKFLEIVWWSYECRFTDIGCSYRAIWRPAYTQMRDHLRASGPEYAAELYVEALRGRRTIIEIPVSFAVRRRAAPEPDQRVATFLAIARLIVRRRVTALAARSEARPGRA